MDATGAAIAAVTGERQIDYGHPVHNFRRIATIWSAILDKQVTPEQVALCMVGVKISREVHKHTEDNIVDGIGYFKTLEMIHSYMSDDEVPF